MSVTMREMLEAVVHFGHCDPLSGPLKMALQAFRKTQQVILHRQLRKRPWSKYNEAMGSSRSCPPIAAPSCSLAPASSSRKSSLKKLHALVPCIVDQRWLGGMLTNFKTVNSIKRLKDMELAVGAGDLDRMSRRALTFRRELEKLQKSIGGIATWAACRTRSSLSTLVTTRSPSPKPTSWVFRLSAWSIPTTLPEP